MNKKNNPIRLSIGTTSIFMIFVILVMCILAVLAYLKANSYYHATLRQIEFSESYYQSESRLLQKFYQLDINDLENDQVDYLEDENLYCISDQINETQQLQLTFKVEMNNLEIVSLKTINLEE